QKLDLEIGVGGGEALEALPGHGVAFHPPVRPDDRRVGTVFEDGHLAEEHTGRARGEAPDPSVREVDDHAHLPPDEKEETGRRIVAFDDDVAVVVAAELERFAEDRDAGRVEPLTDVEVLQRDGSLRERARTDLRQEVILAELDRGVGLFHTAVRVAGPSAVETLLERPVRSESGQDDLSEATARGIE